MLGMVKGKLSVCGGWTGRLGAVAVTVLVFAAAAPAAAAATADVSVTNVDSPDPVTEGTVLGYELTVANAGPDTAHQVKLIDVLPARADFLAFSTAAGVCHHPAKRKVVCRLGALDSGASAVVRIRVRTTKASQIVNRATVNAAGDIDPVSANDHANQTTTVLAPPPPVTCAGRNATIVGTAGGDDLVGTIHHDVIQALAGNDRVQGGGGNDVVCGSGGNDAIAGQGGNDRLRGGTGDDQMRGGIGDDILYGIGGFDVLRGIGGFDRLYGGGGNDSLRGGGGSDRCVGGTGKDSKRACEGR